MSCENTIMRLSEYRRILAKLRSLGFVKVFSDHLAGAIDVSPALVRKDFADFGLTGNRKSGYSVDELIDKLNKILRKNQVENLIMIGCGGLGRAVMNYNALAGEGLRIVAGFDSNPDILNPAAAVPVYDISRLEEYIREKHIRTAVLTVPESCACGMADRLVAAGITGIMNLSPLTLKHLPGCFIRNVNLLFELENTIYYSYNNPE